MSSCLFPISMMDSDYHKDLFLLPPISSSFFLSLEHDSRAWQRHASTRRSCHGGAFFNNSARSCCVWLINWMPNVLNLSQDGAQLCFVLPGRICLEFAISLIKTIFCFSVISPSIQQCLSLSPAHSESITGNTHTITLILAPRDNLQTPIYRLQSTLTWKFLDIWNVCFWKIGL